MEYKEGISGTYATGADSIYNGAKFKHLYSKELQQNLLNTLLEYPELTKSLNFLTSDDKLTPLALQECIIGLEIDRNTCFNNTPQWQLNWYN